jgi:hemerythrin superfamily protein
MNPVQLIKKDHRTVRGLFRKFESADRHSERQQLGQEIIEELSVHAAIEEQLVYPLLRERDARMEDAVLEALEEHHAMKLILDELDELSADHERYRAKMHVVREQVETHIEEEEDRVLPRLEAVLDEEERKEMADAMLAMKEAAPTHPHPAAPDTPRGVGIASLVASVTDAGKDLVRSITSPDRARAHRVVGRRAMAATRGRRTRRGSSGATRSRRSRRGASAVRRRRARTTRTTRTTRRSAGRKRAR